jgi:hypothetical protein
MILDRLRRRRASVNPAERARAENRRQLWQTVALLGGATILAMVLALT